jgi:hypothetical protein
MSPKTIRSGVKDLESLIQTEVDAARIRKPGDGRKKGKEKDPSLRCFHAAAHTFPFQ